MVQGLASSLPELMLASRNMIDAYPRWCHQGGSSIRGGVQRDGLAFCFTKIRSGVYPQFSPLKRDSMHACECELLPPFCVVNMTKPQGNGAVEYGTASKSLSPSTSDTLSVWRILGGPVAARVIDVISKKRENYEQIMSVDSVSVFWQAY